MLLYLSSNGKGGLTDFMEGQELVIKKLIGRFPLKLFAAKDIRNYIGCEYFLVDISCIEEQLDDSSLPSNPCR
ncbi:hypothetical protein [Desulfosporosinus nitroreducens]|uniref:hypothetical protein n=1 Tax=Desulfosporosinus nitroreducens TaxID=2018668 RepID=UPI00207D6B79|nr:hypothetical protein [Desulfosporosinus nitroreducens]MCO1604475.1 hypothetical protein [Desulfosporosinus nitroreducens]